MCRGDPALATSFWRDALPTSRAYSDHECVNWEALDGWARSRMLDMNDPEIFVSFAFLFPSHQSMLDANPYSNSHIIGSNFQV